MSPKDASVLKKAVDLIRAGKAGQARPLLVEFLRQEPNSAQAWFLLSYALEDLQRKQYALMQALRADPKFERAELRLRELRGEPAPKPKPKPIAAPARPKSIAPPPDPVSSFRETPSAPSVPSLEETFRSEIGPLGKPEKKRNPFLLRALVLIAVLGLFALVFIYSRDFFAGLVASQPTATEVESFRSLPPTWTPGLEDLTPTLQPTPTIEGVSPPAQLDQSALNQIALISSQVDLLRGLPTPGSVPPLLMAEQEETPLLTSLYAAVVEARRAKDEGVLRALGLLNTSQTLSDYLFSTYADPYGAVFVADPARVYLVGSDFSDLHAYAYARQYGRATIEDEFSSKMVTARNCSILSDGCRALKAFIQGDWELIGDQWLSAYASASIFQQASIDQINRLVVQTEPPNQLALNELDFNSQTALEFVQAVFAAGGWAGVNGLYTQPPVTSEQILHPEKFLAGEVAVSVTEPALGSALGPDWTLQIRSSLGEWLTRQLFLTDPDPAGRLSEEISVEAADGWGGDSFQVYFRESDSAPALVVHWQMESDAHALDLRDAMQRLLSLRFGTAPVAQSGGDCWSADDTQACLFLNGDEIFWLQLPNEANLLQAALTLIPVTF